MTDQEKNTELAPAPAPVEPPATVPAEPSAAHGGIALSYSDEEMMAMATFADKVCKAGLLPDHLREKPADCLLVLMQAKRWGMDFFAVAQCTSVERGKVMYEGKLVHAALLASGAIAEPFDYHYSGTGENRTISVIGVLPNGEQRAVQCVLKDVRTWGKKKDGSSYKNAWDKQPDTQLAYRGAREWARLYAPHVMLGVVAEGEELPRGEPMNAASEVKLASGRVLDEGKVQPQQPSSDSGPEAPAASESVPVKETTGEDNSVPHSASPEQPEADPVWTDFYPDDWYRVPLPPDLGLEPKKILKDLTVSQIRGFREKFEADLTMESKVFRAALDASYLVEAIKKGEPIGVKDRDQLYEWAVKNEVIDHTQGFEDLDAAGLSHVLSAVYAAVKEAKKKK